MQESKKIRANFRLFVRFLKGSRLFILICFIATAISILFEFLVPQVIRITVDSVIGNEPLDIGFAARWFDTMWIEQHLGIFICILAILVFGAISGVFIYVRWKVMAKAGEGFIQRMRDSLYSHIQKLPYQWHVENKTGDTIQRCTFDVETVQRFITSQTGEMFRVVVMIILALAFMFSMNVMLSFVALLFIPITIAYSGIFYSKIGKKFRVADEAEGELSAVVQENLTGVRVVRAFGRERYEADKFDEKNNKVATLWIKLGYLMGSYWGIGDFITGLQILVIVETICFFACDDMFDEHLSHLVF